MFKKIKKKLYSLALVSITLSLPISSNLVCKATPPSEELTPELENRKNIACQILKNYGYTITKYLGQGMYKVAFEVKNLKGEEVAALVYVSEGSSMSDRKKEVNAVKNLSNIRGLLKSNSSKKIIKHFDKYNNIAEFVVEDSICVLLDGRNININFAIFEAPLAQDLYEEVKKNSSSVNSNYDYDVLLEELRKLAKNLLKALEPLHANKCAHGDVKINNVVFLRKDGKTYHQLIDFGQLKVNNIPRMKQDIFDVGAVTYQVYMARTVGMDFAEELHRHKQCPQFISNSLELCVNPGERIFLEFCRFLANPNPEEIPTVTLALQQPFLKRKTSKCCNII